MLQNRLDTPPAVGPSKINNVAGQIRNPTWHFAPQHRVSHTVVFICNYFRAWKRNYVIQSLYLALQDSVGVMLNENRYQRASEPHTKNPRAVCLTGLTAKRRSATIVCELPENNFTECHILRAGGGDKWISILAFLTFCREVGKRSLW